VIPGESLWTGGDDGVRWTATVDGDDGNAWAIHLARQGWDPLCGKPTGAFDGEGPFRVWWQHRATALARTGVRTPLGAELGRQFEATLLDRTPVPLDAQGQRVVDVLAQHLSTDEWMSGRRLRKELGVSNSEAKVAIEGTMPRYVRAQHGSDGDFYSLTLPGLLASGEEAAAVALVEGVLNLLREKFDEDPDFRAYTSEDLGVTDKQVAMFARSVIRIAWLLNDEQGSGTNQIWGTPKDVEDLVRCRSFSDFMALVRRGTEDRPWPTAPSRLADEMPVVRSSGAVVAFERTPPQAGAERREGLVAPTSPVVASHEITDPSQAAQQIWSAAVRLRKQTPPIFGLIENVTEQEYSRAIRSEQGRRLLAGLTEEFVVQEVLRAGGDIEELRPILAEDLWNVFESYRCFLARVYLVTMGKYGEGRPWYRDSLAIRFLADVLTVEPAGSKGAIGALWAARKAFETEILRLVRVVQSSRQPVIPEKGEATGIGGPAKMVQPIHFDDFSGEQFERLALAYHLRVEPETAWEWYGQVGSDLGRDIWGVREDGTTVCIQCVNRTALTFDKGSGDLDKAARGPKGKPSVFRIVCRSTVSADMRDRLKKHAEGLGVPTCDIWAGADFEERLRRDAEALLKRFFEGVPFPDAVDELTAFASGETAIGENATGEPQVSPAIRLVCIGPEILAEGQRVAANGNRWTLRIDRFLRGNSSALCRFGDDIESVPVDQRFVLLAEGAETDARLLTEFAWRRGSGGIEIEAQVGPPVPPGTVKGLKGTNLRHRPVEGVEYAAVLLQTTLGTPWGHVPFSCGFGTLLGQWLRNRGLKIGLDQLIRLDMTRLATIPSLDNGQQRRPPLDFVKRVVSIKPKLDDATDDGVPVELSLEFAGGGPWSGTVLVATEPFDRDEHQAVLDELLKGP
jgi:hypothetical protein